MTLKKLLPLFALLPLMANCSGADLYQNKHVEEARVTDQTRAGKMLASIPVPQSKIYVSVYDFQDLTGQYKNNEKYTEYSTAVTKGGHAILMKALLDAGNKQWFSVLDRNSLRDIGTERSIIENMHNLYRAADGSKLPSPDPLSYSAVVVEGGIISYDSNIVTGGAGATYLGLNANAKYNRDMVTVSLRLVSVQTGEILQSVTSSKTIFSTTLDTNVLKYVTFDRLLQAEAGFSVNEPVQLAVRQAVETGVYSLIMEGAMDGIWQFKDPAAGKQAIHQYLERRDGKEAVAAADAAQARQMAAAQAEQDAQAAKEREVALAQAAADMAPAAGGAAPQASGDMTPAKAAGALPPELAETVMAPAKTDAAPTAVADNQKMKASDVSEMAPAAGTPPAPATPPAPSASNAAPSHYLNDNAYSRRKLVLPSEDPSYSNSGTDRH